MRAALPALAWVLMAVLAGCSDGARGYVLDDQGGGPDTPERARGRAERQVVKALADSGITAEVAIAPAPVWRAPQRRADPDWYFPAATVTITTAPQHADRAIATVRDQLRPSMLGDAQPDILVVDAAPAATPLPPAAVPVPGDHTYVIQAGDTLATISAVFYGSVQPWRRILDANPGLDAAALPVGQAIVIPAAPK